jgi:hypothetical protein
MVCVEKKEFDMAPQVGFGSEHGIDSIGSYWFYCNMSNVFGQKCLRCPTDLSHVTDFLKLMQGGLCSRSKQAAINTEVPETSPADQLFDEIGIGFRTSDVQLGNPDVC